MSDIIDLNLKNFFFKDKQLDFLPPDGERKKVMGKKSHPVPPWPNWNKCSPADSEMNQSVRCRELSTGNDEILLSS